MIYVGLAVFALGMTACGGGDSGGGKYSDVKSAIKKFNDNTEKWMESMEKADSAKKVAATLRDFTQTMKALKSDMEKMEEKYPELKGMSDPPPELAGEAKKMEELMTKMMSVMMKTAQYADDPEVQKAQKEFEEAMK
jgi:hypothetical protein